MDINIKEHKGFKIFIILLLITILFFTKKDNQIRFMEAFQSLNAREKSLDLVEDIVIDEPSNIYLYENQIIRWNYNKISFLNLDGSIILEKDLNFENPHVVFGVKTIYLMDKNTGDLYLLNREGETIKRIELDEKIVKLEESLDGVIINTKSEDMESIQILNFNGEPIRKHNIDDKNILNYAVSENNQNYLISYLNLGEGSLKSDVLIYSIEGIELAKLDISEEIVFLNEFIRDDIILLTDMNLYLISNGEIKWKRSINSLRDMKLIGQKIWILYDTNLEVIDLKGRTEGKFNIGYEFNKILPFDKYTLVYGDKKIWGIKADKIVLKYESDEEIIDMVSNKSIMGIYRNDKLELYRLANEKGIND